MMRNCGHCLSRLFSSAVRASEESCARAGWHVAVISWMCQLICLATPSIGHAQDEDDPPAVAQRTYLLTEQQFDQMVFGGSQTTVVVQNGVRRTVTTTGQPAADFRKRMDAAVATEIQTVDRHCSLTEAQKKKLQLAGRGDIAQFYSRVAELRPKLTSAAMTQEEYQKLIVELQPLRMVMQFGVIGENSLFRKTLRRTLTDEQRTRYRTVERDQQVKLVESVLLNWERNANGVKLVPDNRRKFVEVLVEHGHLPQSQNPYMHYIVLLEAGRLEERLRPLLTDENWDKLQLQVTQARRVEPSLRKSGRWPLPLADDEDEDAK